MANVSLECAAGGAREVSDSGAVTLSLKPGIWFYRVRGFNWSLPAGAQAMSWSDPMRLVVKGPRFKIVKP